MQRREHERSQHEHFERSLQEIHDVKAVYIKTVFMSTAAQRDPPGSILVPSFVGRRIRPRAECAQDWVDFCTDNLEFENRPLGRLMPPISSSKRLCSSTAPVESR